MNSRVYRNAVKNNSDAFSVLSSAGRTASWSILSGLSLSEVSNIAILALPVYAVDIANSSAYDFETPTTDPVVSGHQGSQGQQPNPKARNGRRSIFKLVDIFRRRSDNEIVTSSSPIFGQPLAEYILLANVAISMMDEQGKPFVYGYIPIVVGKAVVFLKERQ